MRTWLRYIDALRLYERMSLVLDTPDDTCRSTINCEETNPACDGKGCGLEDFKIRVVGIVFLNMHVSDQSYPRLLSILILIATSALQMIYTM
jgi:hypothetical protein